MAKWAFIWLFGGVLIGAFTAPAHAWDQHWRVTAASLQGFEHSDAAIYRELTEQTVRVTPMTDFLTRAFGSRCDWDTARDGVFEGVGKHYRVNYAAEYQIKSSLDWEHGSNEVVTEPVPNAHDPQALGREVTPFEVLRVYSDEPDWQLDDDVERLRGVGASAGKDGIASRMLRHFWYKGEVHYGVDFGAGQETQRRMQTYYELAVIAFGVDQPYWGYRFLANALHYIQDLTQPFHVRALINDSMIEKLAVMHAYLCDDMRKRGKVTPQCAAGDTLDAAVIRSGWTVGTYHLMYEEFGRSLMDGNYYGTRDWVG